MKKDYLPFDSFEKNLQFFYQKNMYFNELEFKKIFLQNYPDAFEILNKHKKTSKEKYKEISIVWSYFKSLNSKTFKCSESYGRIYMPFQLINKEFRKAIRIGNDEKLFELFDVHCCFINLSAKIIIKNNANNNKLVNECKNIIELTNKDLYENIIDWNENKNTTRNKIKKNVMMWIFSNKRERNFFKSKNEEIQIIDSYFKENFPLYYNIVVNYKTINKKEIEKGKITYKCISKLSMECFQYESDLMLNEIIPTLEKEYKNIPFISLHDAIFIPEKFKIYKNEILEKISLLMKENTIVTL